MRDPNIPYFMTLEEIAEETDPHALELQIANRAEKFKQLKHEATEHKVEYDQKVRTNAEDISKINSELEHIIKRMDALPEHTATIFSALR